MFVHLLDSQTEVEDAVRSVGLSVRPPDLSDEAGQSEAQLSGAALNDVLFENYSTGCGGERMQCLWEQVEEIQGNKRQRCLTFCWLLVALLDPAGPGFDPVQMVQLGGGRCS